MAIPLLIGGAAVLGLLAKAVYDNEQEEKERENRAYSNRLERERKEKEKKANICLAIQSYEQDVCSLKQAIYAETAQILNENEIFDGLDSIKSATNTLVKFIKKDFIEIKKFPETVATLAFTNTDLAVEKIQQQYEKSSSYNYRKNTVANLENKLAQLKQLESILKGIK